MRTFFSWLKGILWILGAAVALYVLVFIYGFVKAAFRTLPPDASKDFNTVRDALGRQWRGVQTVMASNRRSSVALMEERRDAQRQIQQLQQEADVLRIEAKYAQASETEKNAYFAGKSLPGDEISIFVYRGAGTQPISAELYIEGAPGPWPQRIVAPTPYKLPAVRHIRYRLIAKDGAGNWSKEFVVEDYPGGSQRIELEIP